jgi:hypothetical protein
VIRHRTVRHRTAVIATALAVGLALLGLLPGTSVAIPPTAASTSSGVTPDALRTGWDSHEPGLTPAVVKSPRFGQVFSTPVDGQVYAKPIFAGRTVIVATENNNIYGIDEVTGAVRWSTALGPAWPASTSNCDDLTPNVGVTGTPVYDSSTGLVFMVAQLNDGASPQDPHFYMFALSARTGAIAWKVPIKGAPINDPVHPFNAVTQLQRPGLLLLNGTVYAAFGSHCVLTPYNGYVAGVNVSTKAMTMWSTENGSANEAGSIWQAGSGLMSDGPGRVFFMSGNGISPAPGPGNKPPGHLAESVVRLSVNSKGGIQAKDFFSPQEAPQLDSIDADLGSGGPVGLPYGTRKYPHLLVAAGKEGRLFILNRDDLGGRKQGKDGGDANVGESGPFWGIWGRPATFGGRGGNDYLYYIGVNDYMRALRFDGSDPAHPKLNQVAHTPTTFGYASDSPMVTSNGDDPASGIVWSIYETAGLGVGGTLKAYLAVPQQTDGGPQLKQIWSAPIGTATKFSVPAAHDNRVYVGTRDGHLLAFGAPTRAPLTGAPIDFHSVGVGASGNVTANVTATTDVTVSAITTTNPGAANPFTTGTPTVHGAPVTLPAKLTKGETLSVPVTMTPKVAGGASGSLTFSTDSTSLPTTSLSLTGSGTKSGLIANPQMAFPTLPNGVSITLPVTITNTGLPGDTKTISSVTAPSPDTGFTVDAPAPGTKIGAGQSIDIEIKYASLKGASGDVADSLTLNMTDGTTFTVPLTGSASGGHAAIKAEPTTLDFGSVPVGSTATKNITITNPEYLAAEITGTVPSAPFHVPNPIAAGQPLTHGYDIPVPVEFKPTKKGPFSSTYTFSMTDNIGEQQTVTVTITGTGT